MTRCLFVPPFVFEALASRTDDPGLADLARAALRSDADLRGRRERGPAAPDATDAERPRRTIYTADNTEALPGRVVRNEGDPPSGDASVDEAYTGVGAAWTLFHDAYSRDSLDDAGHPLDVTVHYGRNYPNAFWDGRRLVFGDGDGTVFRRFTRSPDVIAHEFTHGVTQYAAPLAYTDQSGALNESVSDVFAALTVQRSHDQTADEASWLIGEQIFVDSVDADALRSMKAPGTAYDDPRLGKDPQPATMAGYVETEEDNGGVHINSGIPNHAFYLAATALGGRAWQSVGPVWYAALTDPRLGEHADFATWAALTVDAAERLFPDRPPVAGAVRDAWSSVGVDPADLADLAGLDRTAPRRPHPGPGQGHGQGHGQGQGHAVTVRRSGGLLGRTVECRIDTATAAAGSRVEELLTRVPHRSSTTETAQPDRFVFAIDVDGATVRVHEPDLTPELAELVHLVLGERDVGSD